MTMTKKDYELVQEAITDAKSLVIGKERNGYISEEIAKDELNGILMVQRSLAEKFSLENPQFDEKRFWNGCNVKF